MHQSAALVLDACFTLPLMRDSVGRSIILTIVREKNSHQIIMNLIESKGGFPFSGKYRAIDFFRSLSFELQ